MGASASASWAPLQRRSRSSSELERIRTSTPERRRSRLAALAHQSSKRLAKLSFKRRGTSHREEVRVFRSLISSWSSTEMTLLAREWAAVSALAQLHDEADAARRVSPPLGHELWTSTTKDLVLVYKGTEVPVHSRLFCTRSGLLSRLCDLKTKRVELLEPRRDPPSVELFKDFIAFLYTENWSHDDETLSALREWFESSRSLAEDLALMAQFSLAHGDLELVFASTEASSKRLPDFRIRTDSSVLGARSSLIRRMVERRKTEGSDGVLELQLDEGLLSRVFVPTLLHFVYTDKLDLTKIDEGSAMASWSSLSEARAIVAGRVGTPRSPLHVTIHLFHIAKFLDLPRLATLCEDALVRDGVDAMNGGFESLVTLLRWARAPGGSAFVARKARAALSRHFARFVASPALFHVDADALDECLDCDHLQASEVDVLEAVIRWSEHELVRRMEEREPNLVAETTHSVSRRGVRRGELSGDELREIAAPLLEKVRVRYVLPPFHQSLTNAYKRGLLEQEPLQDLICPSTSELHPDMHWFRPGDDAPGPRLYEPYFIATKAALKWRAEGGESKTSLASLQEMPSTSGRNSRILEDVIVENLLPEILDGDEFEKIAQRVLREAGIDEASVEVRLREAPAPPVQVEPPSVDAVKKATSEPALNWPDLMTLRRHLSQTSIASDYDNACDDPSLRRFDTDEAYV